MPKTEREIRRRVEPDVGHGTERKIKREGRWEREGGWEPESEGARKIAGIGRKIIEGPERIEGIGPEIIEEEPGKPRERSGRKLSRLPSEEQLVEPSRAVAMELAPKLSRLFSEEQQRPSRTTDTIQRDKVTDVSQLEAVPKSHSLEPSIEYTQSPTDDFAQQLHDKRTRGVSLSAEEQAQLDNWYALQDSAESKALGLTAAEKTSTTLQAQIDTALTGLVEVTKRIQKIAAENKTLRREIAALRRQLVHPPTQPPA